MASDQNQLASAQLDAGGDEAAEKKANSSYRDFSRVMPEKHNEPSSILQQTTSSKEPTFPRKLHMILSNPEFQDIIAWLPHGRSWRILQQRAFEERVIPLYFRHGRYSSFARQVNGWGFRRITHGSDYNSYYHELFLRGLPHLTDKMRRLTTKDLGKRKKVEDGPTPDFYALSRENPIPETHVPTGGGNFPAITPPAMANMNAVGVGAMAAASRIQGSSNDLAQADVAELALLERRRQDIVTRMGLLSGNPGLSMGQQNSLFNAAALGMGTGFPNFMGGVGFMNNDTAALQRQLLLARLQQQGGGQMMGTDFNFANNH